MASFLKKILEPSEEDAFDHLTWMEKPCINISEGLSSEDVLPSPSVGLPSALIPRQPPGAAYVTHTGPLVRQLRQQERPGRAGPTPTPTLTLTPTLTPAPAPAPAPARPRSQPSSAPSGGGGTAAGREGPPGAPEDQRPSAPPGVCHMVIFARKPPSAALPRSEPARSSQRQ